jgi:hypothetical protein
MSYNTVQNRLGTMFVLPQIRKLSRQTSSYPRLKVRTTSQDLNLAVPVSWVPLKGTTCEPYLHVAKYLCMAVCRHHRWRLGLFFTLRKPLGWTTWPTSKRIGGSLRPAFVDCYYCNSPHTHHTVALSSSTSNVVSCLPAEGSHCALENAFRQFIP